MAVRPEILAQLARMLGDDALRSATDAQVQAAAEAGFDALVDALVAETAASDDAFDRESALRYADLRLEALAGVLPGPAIERLRSAIAARVSTW